VCVCVNIRVWAMTWQKYKREEKEKRLGERLRQDKNMGIKKKERSGERRRRRVCARICVRVSPSLITWVKEMSVNLK